MIYRRDADRAEPGRSVAMASQSEVLLFVATTQQGDTVVREAALEFTSPPLDTPGDCTAALGVFTCSSANAPSVEP